MVTRRSRRTRNKPPEIVPPKSDEEGSEIVVNKSPANEGGDDNDEKSSASEEEANKATRRSKRARKPTARSKGAAALANKGRETASSDDHMSRDSSGECGDESDEPKPRGRPPAKRSKKPKADKSSDSDGDDSSDGEQEATKRKRKRAPRTRKMQAKKSDDEEDSSDQDEESAEDDSKKKSRQDTVDEDSKGKSEQALLRKRKRGRRTGTQRGQRKKGDISGTSDDEKPLGSSKSSLASGDDEDSVEEQAKPPARKRRQTKKGAKRKVASKKSDESDQDGSSSEEAVGGDADSDSKKASGDDGDSDGDTPLKSLRRKRTKSGRAPKRKGVSKKADSSDQDGSSSEGEGEADASSDKNESKKTPQASSSDEIDSDDEPLSKSLLRRRKQTGRATKVKEVPHKGDGSKGAPKKVDSSDQDESSSEEGDKEAADQEEESSVAMSVDDPDDSTPVKSLLPKRKQTKAKDQNSLDEGSSEGERASETAESDEEQENKKLPQNAPKETDESSEENKNSDSDDESAKDTHPVKKIARTTKSRSNSISSIPINKGGESGEDRMSEAENSRGSRRSGRQRRPPQNFRSKTYDEGDSSKDDISAGETSKKDQENLDASKHKLETMGSASEESGDETAKKPQEGDEAKDETAIDEEQDSSSDEPLKQRNELEVHPEKEEESTTEEQVKKTDPSVAGAPPTKDDEAEDSAMISPTKTEETGEAPIEEKESSSTEKSKAAVGGSQLEVSPADDERGAVKYQKPSQKDAGESESQSQSEDMEKEGKDEDAPDTSGPVGSAEENASAGEDEALETKSSGDGKPTDLHVSHEGTGSQSSPTRVTEEAEKDETGKTVEEGDRNEPSSLEEKHTQDVGQVVPSNDGAAKNIEGGDASVEDTLKVAVKKDQEDIGMVDAESNAEKDKEDVDMVDATEDIVDSSTANVVEASAGMDREDIDAVETSENRAENLKDNAVTADTFKAEAEKDTEGVDTLGASERKDEQEKEDVSPVEVSETKAIQHEIKANDKEAIGKVDTLEAKAEKEKGDADMEEAAGAVIKTKRDVAETSVSPPASNATDSKIQSTSELLLDSVAKDVIPRSPGKAEESDDEFHDAHMELPPPSPGKPTHAFISDTDANKQQSKADIEVSVGGNAATPVPSHTLDADQERGSTTLLQKEKATRAGDVEDNDIEDFKDANSNQEDAAAFYDAGLKEKGGSIVFKDEAGARKKDLSTAEKSTMGDAKEKMEERTAAANASKDLISPAKPALCDPLINKDTPESRDSDDLATNKSMKLIRFDTATEISYVDVTSIISSVPSTTMGTTNRAASRHSAFNGYDPNKLDRIKTLLYSTGSRVHRGRGFERIFSEYWDAVSLRLSDRLSSHTTERCERAVKAFLKSPRLRKLHNKFIMSKFEMCTIKSHLCNILLTSF